MFKQTLTPRVPWKLRQHSENGHTSHGCRSEKRSSVSFILNCRTRHSGRDYPPGQFGFHPLLGKVQARPNHHRSRHARCSAAQWRDDPRWCEGSWSRDGHLEGIPRQPVLSLRHPRDARYKAFGHYKSPSDRLVFGCAERWTSKPGCRPRSLTECLDDRSDRWRCRLPWRRRCRSEEGKSGGACKGWGPRPLAIESRAGMRRPIGCQ